MINNNETIIKYQEYNKIYIPLDYYSDDFEYTISGDEITIYTNENCYTQYNSTYCNCYRYNEKYNIITKAYNCRVDNITNYIIDKNNITYDINYSQRITNQFVDDYIIHFGILILAILITILFKRNSRNI